MPARKKRAPATNNKCDKKQAPDSNTNGNSSDKTKPNEFIPSYEERYKSMKIRLKEILYVSIYLTYFFLSFIFTSQKG